MEEIPMSGVTGGGMGSRAMVWIEAPGSPERAGNSYSPNLRYRTTLRAQKGFTDSVNKLRDANISLLLSHQTFSDLEKVSKEFAKGIWDSTRNKIVLYQNDPEVCDRIAKALGTEKDV